jgi:succinate dehydrogenase/fumarate reductase flavoprotein subunit
LTLRTDSEALSGSMADGKNTHASLMRTESRGFDYREDYPEMDNRNWLKWIIVKNENGAINVGTEDIPIDRYPYKPNSKQEGL